MASKMPLYHVSLVCLVDKTYIDRLRTSKCTTYKFPENPALYVAREVVGGSVPGGSIVVDDIQKGMAGKVLDMICLARL